MNWERLKVKNKWLRFAITLTIGMVHFNLLMWSLFWIDPKTAGWFAKTLLMIWYFGSLVVVWTFLDWYNDYEMTKKAFPNGNYPKGWREWMLPPKKEQQ